MWGQDPTAYRQQMMSNMQLQADMEDFQADRTVAKAQKSEYIKLKTESKDSLIAQKVTKMQSLLADNEQDQIPAARADLEDAVRAKLTEILGHSPSEEEVQNEAKSYFAQGSGGVAMGDAAEEADHGSFLHGVLRVITFGLIDKKTGKQNKADINGTQVSTKDKAWETAGNVLGLAALTTAGYLLFRHGGSALSGTSHFFGQSRMASQIGSLEASLAQAQSAVKAAKGPANAVAKAQAQTTVNTLKAEIAKLKGMHLSNDAAYQASKTQKIIAQANGGGFHFFRT